MTLEDARAFIHDIDIRGTAAQHWADLGCGSGLFSHAIAKLLPANSHVLCMDVKQQQIDFTQKNIKVEFQKADFLIYDFPESKYDGFIMANSLHYVRDKTTLLHKLRRSLKPEGCLLIIEYDHKTANDWVPFPITFEELKLLLENNGLADVRKLSERRSVFGSMMYACQAKPLPGY